MAQRHLSILIWQRPPPPGETWSRLSAMPRQIGPLPRWFVRIHYQYHRSSCRRSSCALTPPPSRPLRSGARQAITETCLEFNRTGWRQSSRNERKCRSGTHATLLPRASRWQRSDHHEEVIPACFRVASSAHCRCTGSWRRRQKACRRSLPPRQRGLFAGCVRQDRP